MFQAHSLLLASCATMKSCPPPAIATAVAMATGQDVQRLSHFATQVSLSGQVEGELEDKILLLCHSLIMTRDTILISSQTK